MSDVYVFDVTLQLSVERVRVWWTAHACVHAHTHVKDTGHFGRARVSLTHSGVDVRRGAGAGVASRRRRPDLFTVPVPTGMW